MCGFVGVLSSDDVKVDIEAALYSIEHRGPDGTHTIELSSSSRKLKLGHVRLAILDTSPAGLQPISFDGQSWLVYNGEIYNFLELREELKSAGCNFITETDTEVLFWGYKLFGAEFLHKCNGMWAFAFWNHETETLHLVRDRFGIKPLYWHEDRLGNIFFASEMKALKKTCQDINLIPNFKKFVANYFNYEHTVNTIYNGISRVPSGYLVKIDNDKKCTFERWWCTLDHLVDVPERYEDQVVKWRELFLDAVRVRMRADVNIGTALSGGLDSSAIFSAMHYITEKEVQKGESPLRRAPKWNYAFNAGFSGCDNDERLWAQKVCDSTGTTLNVVEMDPLNMSWSFKKSILMMEDPYVTLPLPMLEIYKHMSDNDISISIDGHGADELFSGYGHILLGLITPNFKRAYEIYCINCQNKNINISIFNFFKTYLKINVKHAAFRTTRFFLDIIGFKSKNWTVSPDANHKKYKKMSYIERNLYDLFHFTALPTILRNFDRYSMANGVEVRMPFMDWRLVVYTFSLPMNSRLGGSYTKRIMRDALAGILCDDVRVRRDKIGFISPMDKWLKGPFQFLMLDSCVLENLDNKIKTKIKTFLADDQASVRDASEIFDSICPLWTQKILLDDLENARK